MADKKHTDVVKYKASRVRRVLRGTAEQPRLCVFKSSKNLYAQIVDDEAGRVLTGVSTLSPEMKDSRKPSVETGKILGKLIAERAKKLGVTRVRFDRSGYLYHGRVAAIADGAREGGIKF